MTYRTQEAAFEERAIELEARLDATEAELEAMRRQNEQLRLANRDLATRLQSAAMSQTLASASPAPRRVALPVFIAAVLVALAFTVGRARATQDSPRPRDGTLPPYLAGTLITACGNESDVPSTTVKGVLWFNKNDTIAHAETEGTDRTSRCVAHVMSAWVQPPDTNDLVPRGMHFSLFVPGGFRTGRESD